jgi:hypothetical protein
MIDNSAWKNILTSASDFVTVVEFYANDAYPESQGFDPDDALLLYAAVDGVSFMGNAYTRLVDSFSNINRTISAESNSAQVTLSNVSRVASRFELNTGFEGLIMVVRLISKSLSISLARSQILFVGRCEKPQSGNKNSLTVSATWVLGGLEVAVPRRKFTKEDAEGRVSTDAEFEGFPYMPSQNFGSTTYSVRVRRGGIAGFFGFKKTVQKTLSYSSFSDLDANKPVPLVLGRAQLQGTHIAYADRGTSIYMRTAFCEGPIYAMSNVRSVDDRLGLTAANIVLGLVGTANTDATWLTASPPDPSAGYYSRTAYVRAQAGNTLVEDEDPAPDLVAVIDGLLMTIPDSSGDWVETDEFSDNAAAHTYMFITSPYYFNLNSAWIEATDAATCYDYNSELIITRSSTDFTWLIAG